MKVVAHGQPEEGVFPEQRPNMGIEGSESESITR